MISLNPNEKIELVIRRHWYVMAGPTFFLIVLLIAPSVFFTVAPSFFPEFFNNTDAKPIIYFLLSLYVMLIILFLFILWSDYYLDSWILTDKRLIDIQQLGLFNRRISEMHLSNIQNVSLEIKGLIQTLLKFGDIRVETAAEGSFVINDAPDLYHAKELILKYSKINHDEEVRYHSLET